MSSFDEKVGEEFMGLINSVNQQMEKEAPKTELTRRKWNEVKNDYGELVRLGEKYGQENAREWAKKNALRDEMENA